MLSWDLSCLHDSTLHGQNISYLSVLFIWSLFSLPAVNSVSQIIINTYVKIHLQSADPPEGSPGGPRTWAATGTQVGPGEERVSGSQQRQRGPWGHWHWERGPPAMLFVSTMITKEKEQLNNYFWNICNACHISKSPKLIKNISEFSGGKIIYFLRNIHYLDKELWFIKFVCIWKLSPFRNFTSITFFFFLLRTYLMISILQISSCDANLYLRGTKMSLYYLIALQEYFHQN